MSKVLDHLYKESLSYSTVEKMEALIQSGGTFEALPVQPLFFALKELPLDQVSLYLEKLSPKQRRAMLDIDLWVKDKLDVDSFYDWFLAYSHCPTTEVRHEFVTSEQFLLFLKGRFGIHTFDTEDPVYPDHDNYFLTDDNQLLIEFDENFAHASELKLLIGEIYDIMGVEGAYTYLFKMVSDSFLGNLEHNYREKVNHLNEYGIVDYYDALQILSPFPSVSHIDMFIKKKVPVHFSTSDEALNETLTEKYLVRVKDKIDLCFDREFELLDDEKQLNWIRFNFARLINSKMAYEGKLETNGVAIQKISLELVSYLQLGLEYLRSKFKDDVSVFTMFGFDDIYRIGSSLVLIQKKKVDREISKYPKGMETFWGDYLNNTFENLLDTPVKVGTFDERPEVVNSVETLGKLTKFSSEALEILPLVHQFYATLEELKKGGNISDSYYLNYTLDEIEFEAVLISTFFNHVLGSYQDEDHQKRLGLRVEEFKLCLTELFGSTVIDLKSKQLHSCIEQFSQQYGLSELENFSSYLLAVIGLNLSGYEYEHLSYDDYKHVGGVIFFNES
jgi:hypothetical protein